MSDRFAFVTLSTSVHYLPGALFVAAALKEVHPFPSQDPEVPFRTVCLITPETKPLRQNLSEPVYVHLPYNPSSPTSLNGLFPSFLRHLDLSALTNIFLLSYDFSSPIL